MMELRGAVQDVLLGEPLRSLRARYLMAELGVTVEKELNRALDDLETTRAARLVGEANHFVGGVCRWLGEHHAGDRRIAGVIEEWAHESKDYDAFDALLVHFEFPGRERLMAEAKRMFPGTLTAHWV